MKNKSIIAKLLAEEDIFVVYKKMETAYFNPKTRELGLPIWNDELMTADIEDLMVCHEIAHALWTPLDMLEQAQSRKINHSFVNIIEDARIERMVQERYRGSVAVFNRGYRDLTEQDFFSLNDRDVSELNLIDRINLFFKKQKVEFTYVRIMGDDSEAANDLTVTQTGFESLMQGFEAALLRVGCKGVAMLPR